MFKIFKRKKKEYYTIPRKCRECFCFTEGLAKIGLAVKGTEFDCDTVIKCSEGFSTIGRFPCCELFVEDIGEN